MVHVYLTVDVECSMGGAWGNPSLKPVSVSRAICGKQGNNRYGVPLIMDILERNGLRGTFFLEVFAGLNVDKAELIAAYREIVRRGHDAQLHLHPTHYFYRQVQDRAVEKTNLPPQHDNIGSHSLERQVELIRRGIESFEELTGRKPVAFRAGNYGANAETLKALEQVGIRVDSSYNAAYIGKSCLLPNGKANETWEVGAVREMPVTVFQSGIWPNIGLKPFEISSISFREARSLLEQGLRSKMTAITAILHSFSLFKTSDRQYTNIKPDRVVIARLERLCRWLTSRKNDFCVSTLSEPLPEASPAVLPRLAPLPSLARKVVQAVNRAYWF